MASGILGISLSGLYAAQSGIRTTQNNIANVNTVGYHRQELIQTNAVAGYSAGAFFGNGTEVDSVRRLYSQFLDNEVMQNQTSLARDSVYADYAAQIDRLLGDANGGLNTALSAFFASINDLADAPADFAAREALLAAGRNLSGRMNDIDGYLRDLRQSVNLELADIGDRVTALARQVATINEKISILEGTGQAANDLRDQRDQLVSQINELVNVQTVTQSDGSLNLFIGSGHPLVIGSTPYTLTVDRSDPENFEPKLTLGGSSIPLEASTITGGRLGGLLALRDDVLEPALAHLNRIAVATSAEFNRLHNAGIDFTLAAGGDFFEPVLTQTAGSNWINLGFTGNTLANENYTVSYDGTDYTVTRISDGLTDILTPADVVAGAEVTIGGVAQGFTLQPGTPAPANGNAWQLNFKDYAGTMAVAITDPKEIAAAAAGAGGPGDNRNALLLADLQFSPLLNGATIQGAYAQMVSSSANLTSEAQTRRMAYESLVRQAQEVQQSLSGVNLDEEAVNLIRYQQAYQAAARAMQIASTLFDEVLGIVR
jgi:flagellar hook-associated protein 1 FlgK